MGIRKIDVNYRLPDNCCYNCIHSDMNMYGDWTCSLLTKHDNGDLIQPGAVCDKYARKALPIAEQVANIAKQLPTVTCAECVHSFFNTEHIAMCRLDGKPIEDTSGTCSAASLVEIF